MSLEHRHVLVGGGVEHDLRPLVPEDGEQRRGVDDRHQRRAKLESGVDLQLFGEVEQAALVLVEHHKPARLEFGDDAA